MSTRERRVTLALKWHHLDNLTPGEIRDRFEREDIADLTTSTVRDYLREEEAEEVIDAIEQEHANTRLQIAEHEQAMFERAREAEANATEDEWITAMVPKMSVVRKEESPYEVSNWDRLDPEDDRRPEWADERDEVLIFTEGSKLLQPGDEFPVGAHRAGGAARAGTFPEFRTARVGRERDVVNEKQAAMARQEQSQHLQAKGEALGVYSLDVNLNGEIDGEQTITLDEKAAEAIRGATAPEADTDE